MSVETADVVIVGGAVMGSSTAFFLKHELGFQGRVLVIERDPTYQRASSALSASSIRLQFSTPENIRLSAFGVTFLDDMARRFGPEHQSGFIRRGYLMLASAAGAQTLKSNCEIQWREGADTMLLDPAALARRFPWLDVTDLAAGAFGPTNEGSFDPTALLGTLKSRARAAGAEYLTGEVVAVEREGARISAVRLADGRRIATGVLVNAAGPHAGKLAALAGAILPVEPRKRTVFVIDCREGPKDAPLT
ncbi:MAG: FAD-dependent oxidoreductase, partial [Hyphomicrobiaceae bacterium]